MKVFEVCLTNYCNFKCSYCISDSKRGSDKFSEPLKLDDSGNLLLHDKELSPEEVNKRAVILQEQGQTALDEYVLSEHNNWVARSHLKHDYTDWLDFESLIKFVRSQLSNEWVVTLTGGEPLYYPNIEYLITELCKTHQVVVTTNASLVRSKTKLLNISRDKLFFRVGFHPEFRNLKTFEECMKFIIENKFKYVINYVVHPEYYENSSDLYQKHLNYLNENGYLYEITAFEGRYNKETYPRPIMFRNEIEKLLFSESDKFALPRSVIGSSFIMTEPNGEIYECHGKSKKLGNIYSNTLNLERIIHKACFSVTGCNASKSANTYLRLLLDSRLE